MCFRSETASEWTLYGNLKLEFKDPATDEFHVWSFEDDEFMLDIRIGFDEEGYWSLVGTDSIQPAITTPGAATICPTGVARMPDLATCCSNICWTAGGTVIRIS